MDQEDLDNGQVTPPADDDSTDDSGANGEGQPGDGNDGDDGDGDGNDGGAGDGSPKPAEGEPKLFELPDGRKVDYDTAQYIWKEHFLPEFTKKSMRLAELEKAEKEKATKKPEPDYSNLTPEERNAKKVIDSIKDELRTELREEMMAEIKPTIDQSRAASEELEIKAEIKELQGKYTDFEPTAVMQFALSKGYTNLPLEDVYFLMNKDKIVADSASKAKKETLVNNGRKAAAGITPNSSAKAGTGLRSFDPKTDSGKSIDELMEEGFAELAKK